MHSTSSANPYLSTIGSQSVSPSCSISLAAGAEAWPTALESDAAIATENQADFTRFLSAGLTLAD
jgi:hypothetical protein